MNYLSTEDWQKIVLMLFSWVLILVVAHHTRPK